jgi:predicted RNA-binding protein (virulence factor B family)
MQLGKINQLTIARITPPGAYLFDRQGNEVLLPKKYLVPEYAEGAQVSVFVFKDSQNRIVATTETPFILLGDFAYLEVVHNNPFGTFVNWGLDKDLMVPYGEQIHKLEEGEKYLFTLRYDHATDRLYGSMKVKKLLEPCQDDLINLEVDLLVCEPTQLGRSVIVNNRYSGLIFNNDITKSIRRGDRTKGYVKTVREDGKLDVVLEPTSFIKYDQATNKILQILQQNPKLGLSDNSDPDEIRDVLGMSKKTFKQAIGKLFKAKKIIIHGNYIELYKK